MKYPEVFPATEASVLVKSMFDYKNAKIADVVAAGWTVLGFILGQALGQPTQMIGDPKLVESLSKL